MEYSQLNFDSCKPAHQQMEGDNHMRHLHSLADLEPAEIIDLVERCAQIAKGDHPDPKMLAGKTVGLYFNRVSTRTRTAFAVAASRLGANVITYGPHELQISTGETLADTGGMLSLYLDALVVRTYAQEEINELASRATIPIINALTEEEHPTQGIADVATIQQELGSVRDCHVLFAGEGHNIAASLTLALACYRGVRLSLFSPHGFELSRDILFIAQQRAAASGATITEIDTLAGLPRAADVVYTTRWRSMGQEKTMAEWRSRFSPCQVNSRLLNRAGHSRTIFLHDLPADRGAEVSDDVLDGSSSRVIQQARNKLASAVTALEWCTEARTSPLNVRMTPRITPHKVSA